MILNIPPELVYQIMYLLPLRDLTNLEMTCRDLRALAQEEGMQFHTELLASALVASTPGAIATPMRTEAALTLHERLARLKQREVNWRYQWYLKIRMFDLSNVVGAFRSPRKEVYVKGGLLVHQISYRDAGPPGRYFKWTPVPSISTKPKELEWTRYPRSGEDSKPCLEICIDVDQDLLVVATSVKNAAHKHPEWCILIHFYCLSSLERHPSAFEEMVTIDTLDSRGMALWPYFTVTIKLLMDHVAILTSALMGPLTLTVLNWKTGAIKASFSIMNDCRSLLFISPDSLLATNEGMNRLEVLRFSDEPHSLQFVAHFDLPSHSRDCRMSNITLDFLTSNSAGTEAIGTRPDATQAIIQMCSRYSNDFSDHHFILLQIIRASSLLALLPTLSTSQHLVNEISWHEWGPRCSRVLKMPRPKWISPPCGTRFAILPLEGRGWEGPRVPTGVRIYDFSPHPRRRVPLKPADFADTLSSPSPRTPEVVTEASVVKAQGDFQYDLVTYLPYRTVEVPLTEVRYWESVIVEEDKIIGLTVSQLEIRYL